MKTISIRKSLLIGLTVVVLLTAFGLAGKPSTQDGANATFHLQAPAFVGIARADEESIASFMEDEAGMSCYFQASSAITLDDVRDIFRTIEVETDDYIIGSVAVTNYPESEDVHVYVHVDGWIVAYYLAADPVGKIYDWRVYHDTGRTDITTKLENTLAVVAGEAGASFSSGTHYDFRYPNATHLMLIIEWVYNATDSFVVNLPGSFAYYERSWSLGSDDFDDSRYRLDGVEILRGYINGWGTSQGTLTAAQLLPDQFHTIEIVHSSGNHAYGGLALVYREQ